MWKGLSFMSKTSQNYVPCGYMKIQLINISYSYVIFFNCPVWAWHCFGPQGNLPVWLLLGSCFEFNYTCTTGKGKFLNRPWFSQANPHGNSFTLQHMVFVNIYSTSDELSMITSTDFCRQNSTLRTGLVWKPWMKLEEWNT